MFIVGSAERGRVRQRISFRGAFITEHEPSRKQTAVLTFCKTLLVDLRICNRSSNTVLVFEESRWRQCRNRINLPEAE